jgi:hypothetical protein
VGDRRITGGWHWSSADEREEVRLGIEAVMGIKAALDRLGQRNAHLHKERQRAP